LTATTGVRAVTLLSPLTPVVAHFGFGLNPFQGSLTIKSRRKPGVETAVSVMLTGCPARSYITGRLWKLAHLSEVSKRGAGPLLRPAPFPTAGGTPGSRRWPMPRALEPGFDSKNLRTQTKTQGQQKRPPLLATFSVTLLTITRDFRYGLGSPKRYRQFLGLVRLTLGVGEWSRQRLQRSSRR